MLQQIIQKYTPEEGLYNLHSHPDRFETMNLDKLDRVLAVGLKEKHRLTDAIRESSSEADYYWRMYKFLNKSKSKDVENHIFHIDVDDKAKLKALNAVEVIKSYLSSTNIKTVNNFLHSILGRNKKWFIQGAEKCDIIGSLPAKDMNNRDKHFDSLFGIAKDMNKPVHLTVDQNWVLKETETEQVLNAIEKHGMEGKCTLIHCISLNCHTEKYRKRIYEQMVKTGTSVISCPRAWMDHPAQEREISLSSYIHEHNKDEFLVRRVNSFTPVREMLEAGVVVGLGTDNVQDWMCPFIDTDITKDIEAICINDKIYDEELIKKLICDNPRKIFEVK